MDISKTSASSLGAIDPKKPQAEGSGKNENFMETMKSFLSEANTLQKNASDHVDALIAGETSDVHDVMIAMEKASVSFEMVMEIRNRMLEAYQEIMRTQV